MKPAIFLWRMMNDFGDSLYVGTEGEAETRRALKTFMERCSTMKRRLNPVGPAHLKDYVRIGPFIPGERYTMGELFAGIHS